MEQSIVIHVTTDEREFFIHTTSDDTETPEQQAKDYSDECETIISVNTMTFDAYCELPEKKKIYFFNDKQRVGEDETIVFDYEYDHGKVLQRKVHVHRVFYGTTNFFKEPQWLIEGSDENNNMRHCTLAMNRMKNVERII